MPTYCFTSANGDTIDRDFTLGECPPSIVNNEIEYIRNYSAECVKGFVNGSKTPVKQGHGTWPMEPCVSSGVQPWQAQELRDFHKKHGITAEVNNDGDPIYESPGQRRKALKARNIVDKSSFN